MEPPQDLELQMLIDRTASYVCRQNLEFGHQKGAEKIGVVKKLHKEKFAFLFPENKYNSYYLFKVRDTNRFKSKLLIKSKTISPSHRLSIYTR